MASFSCGITGELCEEPTATPRKGFKLLKLTKKLKRVFTEQIYRILEQF